MAYARQLVHPRCTDVLRRTLLHDGKHAPLFHHRARAFSTTSAGPPMTGKRWTGTRGW